MSILLRFNHSGHFTHGHKSILAMSHDDLQGKSWSLHAFDRDGNANETALRFGKVLVRGAGLGDHTPLPFNHVIEIPSLQEDGLYEFRIEGEALATSAMADIHLERPWALWKEKALAKLN